MMLHDLHAEKVVDCLSTFGTVVPLQAARWRLSIPKIAEPLEAWQIDPWLRLRWQPPPHRERRSNRQHWPDPIELLKVNATLAGHAKISLSAGHDAAHAAADIPLDDDADLASRVVASVQGIVQAQRLIQCRDGEPGAAGELARAVVHGATAHSTADPQALTYLARESGWPFQPRDSGPAFRLEVDGEFVPAAFELDAAGAAGLQAVLETSSDPSTLVRAATARFLAAASGLVRLARVIATDHDGASRFAWEVRWPGLPSVGELRHALAALSVGASLTCREVRALGDEPIARRFLDVRGWSSPMRSLLSEAPYEANRSRTGASALEASSQ